MPYCMNCGKQLSKEKFCPGCGTPLNAQKPYPDQSQNPKKLKGFIIGSNSVVCIVILIIIGLTLNKAQPGSMRTNEARTIIAEVSNSVTIPKNTTPQHTFYPDGRLLSAGGDHLVGLRANGTVVAKGNNETGACNVSNWKGIVAVAAGDEHTVGLMSNGRVVATGTIDCGTGDVSSWNDIVAIAAGSGCIIGLKSDGTVESAGNYVDHDALSEWRDIVAISAGEVNVVGLKSDGTVVGVWEPYQNLGGVSQWRDIVAVSVGYYHAVGLKSDGTVVAIGFNEGGQCDVTGWKDIVAIAAGESCTLGLKADGTVVAAGDNYCGQCDVSDWEDIVAISVGYAYTVGLKSDGTLVTAGSNYSGQRDVSSWNLFLAADNGNTQTTADPLDGGQTYNIYRSSKVLQMKRGKHYPYIVNPEIVDCLGFTMEFSYNVPDGNYVKNIWEVWLRENGNSWIMVGTIAVNEGETKEYVINFSRPITFSEIAIQHPIDYNNYSFTDNLTISNIQY